MTTSGVKQLAHIKLGGGVRHRLGIVIATEVALRKGWAVEDMSTWRGYGEEPDLVIRRKEKIGTAWVILRYRVEVIDSHDPIPEWDRSGGFQDVVKIHVNDKSPNQILEEAELRIP